MMLYCEYIFLILFSIPEKKINFVFVLRLQNEKWMSVKVGDIIKLENNQFVAVSILYCLKTLSQVKIVYVLNYLHLQIQQICTNLA